MIPWLNVVLPIAVAGSGVAAAAISLSSDDAPAPSGRPAVWIDAPADGAQVLPGTVTVHAHAAGEPAALELIVDGEAVTADGELEARSGLRYATFDWTAAAGIHELQVTTDDGAASLVRVVFVLEPGSTTVAATTTTSTPATTSSSSTSSTTTTTTPPTTSAVPTTPRPTAPPVTAPPTVPLPSIGQPTLVAGACELPYNGTVTAAVANAVTATVRVTGADVDNSVAVNATGGAVVAVLPISISGGPHTVTVVAQGADGGTASVSVSATMPSCKP